MRHRIPVAVALMVASTVWFATDAAAGAPSDLKCYKIKDGLKLSKAVMDVSALGGVDPGCKVGKAKLFCAPADHTVVSAQDKGTKPPTNIVPLPVTGPDPGMRMCYPIKCPAPSPPDMEIVDALGVRTVSKLKPTMLCLPAYQNKPTCTSPQPPQCTMNDPCTNGTCSTTGTACSTQANCALQPNEQCCCNGSCL